MGRFRLVCVAKVLLLALTRKARNAAVASGVVVNGLAIENEIPDLHVFFRDNLIGGAGASRCVPTSSNA